MQFNTWFDKTQETAGIMWKKEKVMWGYEEESKWVGSLLSENGMLATAFIFDIQHSLQRVITANTCITEKYPKPTKNPETKQKQKIQEPSPPPPQKIKQPASVWEFEGVFSLWKYPLDFLY